MVAGAIDWHLLDLGCICHGLRSDFISGRCNTHFHNVVDAINRNLGFSQDVLCYQAREWIVVYSDAL